MTSVLVVLIALVVPSYVPAFWLARSPLPALALAPMITGLTCAFGGILALVTRTALLPWIIVVAIGANVAVILYQRARVQAGTGHGLRIDRFAFGSAVPLVLVVAPLLTVRQAPHGWDARSIWWFHADWFWAGGASLAHALGNPAFVFSHSDYPPLAPATIGAVWRLRSGGDLEFAQLVSAFLTVAPVVLLAMAIGGRFVVTAGQRVGTIVSALTVFAVYGGTKVLGTDGYVDLQWAAAFCAATVILLLGPGEPRHVAIGAISLAFAALTKNEGMLSAVVLLAVVALRFRGRWRLLALPGAAVAAGFAWMILVRMHGAESDLAGGSTATSWLRGDFVGFDRLQPTLTAVWNMVRGTMIMAVVTVALGVACLRRDRSRLAIPGAGYLWLVTVGVQCLIVLAYVISPVDLQWHLASSLNRTMLVVQLLLLVEVVVWIGVAVAVAIASRGAPTPRPLEDSSSADVAVEDNGSAVLAHSPR